MTGAAGVAKSMEQMHIEGVRWPRRLRGQEGQAVPRLAFHRPRDPQNANGWAVAWGLAWKISPCLYRAEPAPRAAAAHDALPGAPARHILKRRLPSASFWPLDRIPL